MRNSDSQAAKEAEKSLQRKITEVNKVGHIGWPVLTPSCERPSMTR